MAHRVRRVVKAVGTTVAIIIALGAPLGIGAAEYAEFRFDLRREAERTAARVVEQIGEIGPLWPHETGRLREILAATADGVAEQSSREALLDSRGVLIVAQDRDVEWPRNHVKVPVRAGEQLIGWLERQESAWPILEEMGVVALISGLFGIAAFFGFRTLPLRVLDRTFARLEAGHQVLREREADLREQYLIRDAALNTMSQGLSMFDADWRLVICNQRYAKLYDLPPELTEPGTPFSAIVEHRIATNNFVGTPEEYKRITASRDIHPITLLREQRDGRVIEIVQEPSPDGGWVATHEDITERKRVEAQVREQNATLLEQDRQLRKQNIWLDAALNNMSQGLCMFDAEGYLVVCNRRFADLYQLPETLTGPGTPLESILAHRMERGFYGPTPEVFLHQVRLRVASNQMHVELVEQMDGRVIQLTHEPVADGGWVATHEDITERRRADARIAYLATHDPLTDLPNRVLFRDKLDKAIADAQHGSSFAVHCLDLDRFKEVNDTLGHPIGDALLIQVAARLRAALHTSDAVARLGGDEFALIQCQLQRPEQASALAEQIIELIAQPFDIDGHEIVVATSIGVAIAPEDGVDPDQLLKSADLALYRAKSDGRGTFRFFEKEMDARLHARRRFESELRAALGNGEMEVYYQPLFNLQRNTISGFEALLRWHHPERGMVSPEEFIPVAEDTGLILPIGEWVLRQACAEAATWPADLRLAVNLSPVQFKGRNLVGTVMSALAAAGLDPGSLELEVTETVILHNNEATTATLHKLRGLGIRIAMDDFGTGYSSLSYLRSFPFDNIKIDRSFVRDLSAKPDSLVIVHAITDLARNLGMTTTAEGVETEQHREMLRNEGCTEIQGYLISPPKPAAAIPGLLAQYRNGDCAASRLRHRTAAA